MRITHLPTGIVVAMQESARQHKNRAKAMRILRAKLSSAAVARRQPRGRSRAQVGSGDRSERIRTYNFPQNRVTDHRIELTLYKIDRIILGRVRRAHRGAAGRGSGGAAGGGGMTHRLWPIFDGHNDAVQHLAEYREGGRDFLVRSDNGHLDLRRAGEGGMVGGLFALFAKPERPPQGDFARTADGYEVRLAAPLDPAYARNRIRAQLDALNRVVTRAAGKVRWAASVDAIEAARRDGVFAMVLHMEGADAHRARPRPLSARACSMRAGLRSIGPVWSRPNPLRRGRPLPASPHSPDTGPGLTDAGKALIRACNRLGVMIDLSHLNERGFWDVASPIRCPPRRHPLPTPTPLCPSTRNLTDKQLDAIRELGGVVGFNLSVCDVRPDGHLDEDTPIDTIVHHLGYLIDRLGEDHVALGSDFDGAVMPRPIKDASCLPTLMHALRAHGFGDVVVRKIAMENWLRGSASPGTKPRSDTAARTGVLSFPCAA